MTRTAARALVPLLLLTACRHATPGQPEAKGPRTVAVTIDTGGRTLTVRAEVADTPEARARGLMFRKQLDAYAGMIFVFDRDEVQSFWMKNTYIPLDMLFIDRGGKVVGIVENAAPLTLESRTVGLPSRFVLEVQGGFCRRHGVKPGARVRAEGLVPAPG